MTTEAGRVLVVDDNDSIRKSMVTVLKQRGFEAVEASSGEEALERIRERAPDAVLLDLVMSGMSGYEVCVKLKTQPATATIPVLIISSLSDREDRLRGMEAGADDYLVKPVDAQEVVLRVRNAIRMRALLRQTQDNARVIKELESVRDELTQLIVRDMKTPLAGLAGLLELADQAAVKHLDGEASYYLNEALGATETLGELVDSLLDVRRMMAGELTVALHPCDMYQLAGVCAELLKDAVAAAGLSITVAGVPTVAACDEGLIRRVIQHLVRYAVRRSARGQAIAVDVRSADGRVAVTVTDHGRALTEAEVSQVRQWYRGEMPGSDEPSTGRLGFTFCRLVVQAHGGDIDLTSDAQATTSTVRIPMGDVAASAAVAASEPPKDLRTRRYLADRRGDAEHPALAAASLSSLGTRARFAVAIALMSALPLLAFMYLLADGVRRDSVSFETLYWVTPAVVALVVLGIVLLVRHSLQVERLRRYLEVMARGGVPRLAFGDGGEDFAAIERCLGAVIRQTDDRIRVIEAQSRALLAAEQQRVMIETLGAACHHLGQPATVIRVYLEMMQKKEQAPEMQRMIAECRDAAESVSDILHRLQGVAKYQTEPYLQSRSAQTDDHILKI